MHGSGAVFCSCSLLIRGPILPAVRQKLHLSPCADSRSRLSVAPDLRSVGMAYRPRTDRGTGHCDSVSYLPARRQNSALFEEKSPGLADWRRRPDRGRSAREYRRRALRGRSSRSIPHANGPKGLFFLCLEIHPVLLVNIIGAPSTNAASVEAGLYRTGHVSGGRGVDTPDL